MRNPAESSSPAERIEQESAAWVLRQDRGLTSAEQDQFSEWLAADPRHGACLARHRQNWERLDLLARWRPEHASQPNRDLLAPRPVVRWPERQRWLVPLALAAAAAIAGVFFLTQRRAPDTPASAAAATGPVPAFEERTLDDGSIVDLHGGAEFAVAFTASERHVRLERGEAHFTVAKNPNRPFIVSVAGVDVRAVGTQFDVLLKGNEVDVLVTEGRVRVGPIPLVSAGEKAIVPLDTAGGSPRVESVSAADAVRELIWRPALVDFTGAPLSEYVAAFNRHNPIQLIIADPALGNVHLSARFRSDNIEGFVRLLERGFDIRADRSGETILLRKAP